MAPIAGRAGRIRESFRPVPFRAPLPRARSAAESESPPPPQESQIRGGSQAIRFQSTTETSRVQRIANVAIRPVGDQRLGVQLRVVDHIGAEIRGSPRANRRGRSYEQRVKAEDNARLHVAMRVIPLHERPDDIHSINGVSLKRDPEMNQIEERTMPKLEFGSFHGRDTPSRGGG